ncbi:MAG: glycosyltransferase family 39 protein [Elusimicrobiota bacterium]
MNLDRRSLAPWAGFGVCLACFLLIKRTDMVFCSGDENLYFYYGKLVSEGKLPYRDFFFAHQPLQLYVYALLFKLFGFRFLVLKWVSAACASLTALSLFLSMKKEFRPAHGVLASALFLFSHNILHVSTYNLGLELCLCLFAFSCLLLQRGRPFAAGLVMGLSLLTRLHPAILVLALGAFLLRRDRRTGLRFALGTTLMFGAGELALLASAGGAFYADVFAYHARLRGISDAWARKLAVLSEAAKHDILPLFFAVGSLFSSERRRLALPAALSGVYLAFLLCTKGVFNYYLMMLMPALSAMAACALMDSAKDMGRLRKAAFLSFAVILSIFSHYREYKDSVAAYEVRRIDNAVSFITASSKPEDTLFGDDYSTPLIALLSGRRVALDMADTNPNRFQSGFTDIRELTQALGRARPAFMIFHHIGNYSSLWDFPEMREFVQTRWCAPGAVPGFMHFEGGAQHLYIYRCVPLR